MASPINCTLRASLASSRSGGSGDFNYLDLRLDANERSQDISQLIAHESSHELFVAATTFGHIQKLVRGLDEGMISNRSPGQLNADNRVLLRTLDSVMHAVSCQAHEMGATYLSIVGTNDSEVEVRQAAERLPTEYRDYYRAIAAVVTRHLTSATWLQYQAGWTITAAALNPPLYEVIRRLVLNQA